MASTPADGSSPRCGVDIDNPDVIRLEELVHQMVQVQERTSLRSKDEKQEEVVAISPEDDVTKTKDISQNDAPRKETSRWKSKWPGTVLKMPPEITAILANVDFSDSGVTHVMQNMDFLADHMRDYVGENHPVGGVRLVKELLTAQRNNEDEIAIDHMPEKVRSILKRWDKDGNGKVGACEFAKAAQAMDHVASQNKMMKKLIIALTIWCILMMSGVFVVSLIAANLAKDTEIDGAVQKTTSGLTLQVGSSDFAVGSDGKCVLRHDGDLPAGQSNTMQVAQSEEQSPLSSTLPDATFRNLKSLKLNAGNQSLWLTISSFERKSVRSSRCGSLVYLSSEHGHLILDDTHMSVDTTFENFLKNSGLGHMLVEGASLTVGRRLQGTDGMLTGFFRVLEGVEQRCESQLLEAPEDLTLGFHAKIEAKEKVFADFSARSRFFKDVHGNFYPKAGYEIHTDDSGKESIYRVWKEDLLSAPGLDAIRTHSAMQPFLKQVRIEKDDAELSLTLDETKGYSCFVEPDGEWSAENSSRRMNDDEADGNGRLQFVGLVEENGMVLRHFVLHLVETDREWLQARRLQSERDGRELSAEDQNGASEYIGLVNAGIMPSHMEYWDVDTDASGKRESGTPYRVRYTSDVEGATAWSEKTYVSITKLEDVKQGAFQPTMTDALEFFNVTKLGKHCVARNATNIVPPVSDMLSQIPSLPLVGGNRPPAFLPREEMPTSILYSYDRLYSAVEGEMEGNVLPESTIEALTLARATPAWACALDNMINDANYRAELVGLAEQDAIEETNHTNTSRRMPSREERRRLSEDERRLGRKTFEFAFNSDGCGGNVCTSIEVAVGIAGFSIEWEASRDSAIVNLVGSASGEVPIWRPPRISIGFGGDLGVDKGGGAWTVSGALRTEITVAILRWGLTLGLEVGGSLDISTKRINEVYGTLYMNLGRLYLEGTLTMTPTGCGSRYYKRWEANLGLAFGRVPNRRGKGGFEKGWDLFSLEIGRNGGC